MPNVDPPWDKPQDTQYCPNCEELARKLAAAEQRLGVASKVIHNLIVSEVSSDPQVWEDAITQAQAFLSNAPKSEWVGVRREDLEWAQSFTPEHWSDGRPCEYYNRIQVILGREPVGMWQPRPALTPGGKKDA